MARRALSASRAADLLNFLAAHPDERLTYSELSRRLGISLASMHSILATLTEYGYLSYQPSDRSYALGSALVAIGDASLKKNPYVDATRSRMDAFSARSRLETLAFVRAGADTLCVARAGTPAGPGRIVHVGQRVPLIAPLAAAVVAWASDEEQAAWIERGGAPQVERRQQRVLLEVVRERGYSVALEVEGRRRLGDALEGLRENPHSRTLRREMRRHIAELGQKGYPLKTGSTASYAVSTITAPVLDEYGDFAVSVSLQGFAPRTSGAAIARIGEELVSFCRDVARGAAATA